MKKFLWLSILALTVLVIPSCKPKNTEKKPQKDTVATIVDQRTPLDAKWTAFARYMAGVHDDNNDSLEQREYWKMHAAKTDLRWRLLMQTVGTPIATWVSEKKYLPSTAPKTLLYPFAGGDFFYANLFVTSL